MSTEPFLAISRLEIVCVHDMIDEERCAWPDACCSLDSWALLSERIMLLEMACSAITDMLFSGIPAYVERFRALNGQTCSS